MMRTFFRHYSLYEYSFKPKIELVIQTIPKNGITKTPQPDIIPNLPEGTVEIDALGNYVEPSRQSNLASDLQNPMAEQPTNAVDGAERSPAASHKSAAIDWDKVGRIYKPESAVEHIISQEMGRLRNALDMSINN